MICEISVSKVHSDLLGPWAQTLRRDVPILSQAGKKPMLFHRSLVYALIHFDTLVCTYMIYIRLSTSSCVEARVVNTEGYIEVLGYLFVSEGWG